MNWEIYHDGEHWNYRLAQDEDEADFTGSVTEVYEHVTEMDKRYASQFHSQRA